MVKINSTRLNTVIEYYKTCLEDTEFDYNKWLNEEGASKRSAERAFKSDIIDFFRIIEDYSALMLKTASIGITKKTLNQALDLCTEQGFIEKDFRDLLKEFKDIRDSYSHKYGQPDVDTFVEFYLRSKNLLLNHLICMESILDKAPKSEVELNLKSSIDRILF